MCQVGIAHLIGHLRDVDLLFAQQACRLLHAQVTQELAAGDAGHLLHLAVQLGTADAYVLGQRVDIVAGLRHVGIDRPHDALHQHVVVAFHLYILYALLLLDGTAELAAQPAYVVYQVVNLDVQFLHVERLGNIGIGTRLQALQFVLHLGLRRQHDDGQLRDLRVLLDALQHGDAVHLGHHHVADDEVVVAVRQQHLQALLAVGGVVELVAVAQLVDDVVGYLVVVVDDEDAELAELAAAA